MIPKEEWEMGDRRGENVRRDSCQEGYYEMGTLEDRNRCFVEVREMVKERRFSDAIEVMKEGYVKSFHNNVQFLHQCQDYVKGIFLKLSGQQTRNHGLQYDPELNSLLIETSTLFKGQNEFSNELFNTIVSNLEQISKVIISKTNINNNQLDTPFKINIKSKISLAANSKIKNRNSSMRCQISRVTNYNNMTVTEDRQHVISSQTQKKIPEVMKESRPYLTEVKRQPLVSILKKSNNNRN